MRKKNILNVLLISTTILGGLTFATPILASDSVNSSQVDQRQFKSVVEDQNFNKSGAQLGDYNLKASGFGSYQLANSKLSLLNERVYNTNNLTIGKKYRITLKNATGKLTIFNGIADIQHFDISGTKTVSHEFTAFRDNIEGSPKLGIGSVGNATLSGYTLELID